MTKIRSTDSSRMDDARGQGGGFSIPGIGGGLPGGLPVGGGLLGVIIVVVALVLPKLLNAATPAGFGGSSVGGSVGRSGATCSNDLEQIVCGVTNDVQDFWAAELPKVFGVRYQDTKTRLFDEPISTGCGTASPQTGPFYCPADQLVYIDLGFMQQIESQFVGGTSDLAEQYIVAHEYGHHVQNLLGTSDKVRKASQQNPARANEYSVALELQADCLAGVWVGDANRRGRLDSPTEIQEAIRAAEGVGDDRIQQQTSGRINPESWTHGSAAQRHQWFMTGFDSIDPTRCSTFEGLH